MSTEKGGVLFITRNFPPMIGGMEHLIYNCAIQVSARFRATVVGPPGGEAFVGGKLTYVAARARKPLLLSLLSSLFHAFPRSITQRPETVFCGSGLVAPIGYMCGRLIGAKCVVYLHGLDIVVDSWMYQKIFIPIIRRFDLVITNSDSSFQSAIERQIPESKLKILYPGTDVPGYYPEKASSFKLERGLNDCPTLLYIGRITKRKGLLEFVENCAVPLLHYFPDLKILIVGEDAVNSIAANDPVIARLQNYVQEHSLEENFVFFGETTDREIISQAYWSTDLVIFPVHLLPNDIEGFGMVAVEAAAHGIPTVAFRVGGLVNSVDDGTSGILVDYPDYDAFTQAIVSSLRKEIIFEPELCIEHGTKYSWHQFGEKLTAMLMN